VIVVGLLVVDVVVVDDAAEQTSLINSPFLDTNHPELSHFI